MRFHGISKGGILLPALSLALFLIGCDVVYLENPFRPGDVLLGSEGEAPDGSSDDNSSPDTEDALPPEPAAPTAAPGDAQADLTWEAVPYADTYTVYRHTADDAPAASSVQTGISTTTFTDTGLTNGTTYYYWVAGVNTVYGEGPKNSAAAQATPQATPGTPSLIEEYIYVEGSAIHLRWTAAADADSYTIYGNTTGSPFTESDILKADHSGTISYNVPDTDLTPGSRYYFAVRAFNGDVPGPLSAEQDCLYVYWETYGGAAYDDGSYDPTVPFSLSMENNGSVTHPFVAAAANDGSITIRENRNNSGWAEGYGAPGDTVHAVTSSRAALEHYQGMIYMGVNTGESQDRFLVYGYTGSSWGDLNSTSLDYNTDSSLGDISVHYHNGLRGFALWAKQNHLHLAECTDMDMDNPSWTTFDTGTPFPVAEGASADWPAADVASTDGGAFTAYADSNRYVGGVYYNGTTVDDSIIGLPTYTWDNVLCVDCGQGQSDYYLLVKNGSGYLDLYRSDPEDGTNWGSEETDLAGYQAYSSSNLAALTVDSDGNPYAAMVDSSGKVRVLTPAPSGIWESVGGAFAAPETAVAGHIAIELDRLTNWDGTGSSDTLRLLVAVREYTGNIQVYRLVK